ncbi:MAG: hypothetical protein HW386_1852 [Gammaproteobacteria bacterium]|nr:hypothetical protein [Gammaproteobacteria bacterium]
MTTKMNLPRILAGGLLAGLIMNVGEGVLHGVILANETGLLYEKLQVPVPDAASNLPLLIVATFLLGIGAVWVYAAIRPRFGAGPRTAVIAGLLVWGMAYVYSGFYLGNGYAGIIPVSLAWLPVPWGLFEALLATLAGAALYKE